MHALSELLAAFGPGAPLLALLVKATLILVLALLASMILHRASAGARHVVWLASLASLLLIPALVAWSPLRLAILPAPFGAGVSTQSAALEIRGQPSRAMPRDANAAANVRASADGHAVSATPAGAASQPAFANTGLRSTLSSVSAIELLLLLWGSVALVIAANLVRAALTVRRIIRNSVPLTSPDWVGPLYEVSDRLALEEPPQILRSARAKMPFACGVLTPTIVLPADCETWSTERRAAVLLHELAHVKRRDLLGHTIGRIACAIYWFHPLVWTGAKRLRAESERACDDIALACGARATDYAEHLLDIVTSVKADTTPAVALAMARRKEFEGRMLAILDPALERAGPSRRQSLALAGSMAAVALLLGAAAPMPREAHATVDASLQANSGDADVSRTPQYEADDSLRRSPAREHAAGDEDDSGLGTDTAALKTESAADAGRDAKTGDAGLSLALDMGPAMESAMREMAPAMDSAIRDAVAPTVSKVVTSVVPRTVDAVVSGLFGRSTAATQPDERAAVLMRILRTDSTERIRRVAAWGLHGYRSSSVSGALAEAVRRDASATVREMAAWALGAQESRDGAAEAALSSAVTTDPDSRVRRTAAWALGSIESKGAVDALARALSDTSASVRKAATWAIGSIGGRSAPRQLFPLLRDPNSGVRLTAAWALYEFEDPAAVGPLRDAIRNESDASLRLAYVRALVAIGDASVDAISELVESSDARVREAAIRSLARASRPDPWPWPWPWPRPRP